jgi:catechol 2,3-dioxygenase-like lactoylglutathione lyase family enzyme
MIQASRHVLAVQSLSRSTPFYRDILGFEVIEVGDPNDDTGWRFFRRDNCYIMLGASPDTPPPSEIGSHAYFAYLERISKPRCEDRV